MALLVLLYLLASIYIRILSGQHLAYFFVTIGNNAQQLTLIY